MNGFFEKVYTIVAKIPSGKVATYGQIARMLGQPHNARVVGWAMQKAPAERRLPCHRVVSKDGSLAPNYAFGGKHIQRAMLEEENISFDSEGRVIMHKHMWDPLQDHISDR